MPEMPKAPEWPGIPNPPEWPDLPEIPKMPELPDFPKPPEGFSPPGLPNLPESFPVAAGPKTVNRIQAPVTIQVTAEGSDPEALGESIYHLARRYQLRTLKQP